MKQHFSTIFAILVIIFGLGIFFYPNISDWYIQRHQAEIIKDYSKKTKGMSKKEIKKIKKAAQDYNKSLMNNRSILTDPFDEKAWKALSFNYKKLLNVNGVMAYIEIPKIKVYLPVYHGTDKKTLEKGIGHLQNTSLPIGGKGTHCVLSGHSGLPAAMLFTNLDQLKTGDQFYIHVLDEILAYKVDQIKVVEPEDISLLSIQPEEDYVTLVTCTPFGKNTHRLLVRGKRTAYHKDQWKKAKDDANNRSLWDRLKDLFRHRGVAVQIFGAGIGLIIAMIIVRVIKKKQN